jgi:hypothetical protein
MTKIDRKVTVAAIYAKAPHCTSATTAPSAGKAIADMIFAHIRIRNEAEPGWDSGTYLPDLVDAAGHLAAGKLLPGDDPLVALVNRYAANVDELTRLRAVIKEAEMNMPPWAVRGPTSDVLGTLYVHLRKAAKEVSEMASDADDSWFQREVERRIVSGIERVRRKLGDIQFEAYDRFGCGAEMRRYSALGEEDEILLRRIWDAQKRIKTFAGAWSVLAVYDATQVEIAVLNGNASGNYPGRALIQDAMARIMALAHPEFDLVAAE